MSVELHCQPMLVFSLESGCNQLRQEELERRQAAVSLPRRHRLSIDICIDDAAKGTVTRCELETDLPVPGN